WSRHSPPKQALPSSAAQSVVVPGSNPDPSALQIPATSPSQTCCPAAQVRSRHIAPPAPASSQYSLTLHVAHRIRRVPASTQLWGCPSKQWRTPSVQSSGKQVPPKHVSPVAEQSVSSSS